MKKNIFDVDGTIWVTKQKQGFIGKGRIELLQNIQIYGSISKAAKQMKMSYKAAWDSVDIMNKLSNKPLVTKVTGGKGGGGTVITAYAKELIKAYQELFCLYQNYFETLSDSFNANLLDDHFEEPVFCRLKGVIRDIKNIDDTFELSIELSCGQILTSIESKKFVLEKNLSLNDEIHFLIETNNITLTKDINNNSARNVLEGEVTNIVEDGMSVNITLNCGSQDLIYSKITTSSYKKLNIHLKDRLKASFKAYNITII